MVNRVRADDRVELAVRERQVPHVADPGACPAGDAGNPRVSHETLRRIAVDSPAPAVDVYTNSGRACARKQHADCGTTGAGADVQDLRGSRRTSHEFRVLSYLMHHSDRVVTQAELVEHIYAQNFERDSNTVEVFVARLRRKLGNGFIETVRGLGYRLAP